MGDPDMTPQQRTALLASARRFGLTGSLVIAVAGAGFTAYDNTNASRVRVEALRDSVVMRRTLDSLRSQYEYQALRVVLLRTDSAVQKLCVRLKAGC